jgi:hypothetical protein
MSGHIIPLRSDAHAEVQSLLPWFVTGRLEAEDLALVEAHLAQCAECRAEASREHVLRNEVAAIPVEAPSGWTGMSALLDARRPARAPWAGLVDRLSGLRRGLGLGGPAWVGWALAAQAALVVALVSQAPRAPAPAPAAAYHVLGAAPAAHPGNVVVIFRPETREADLRAVLRAGHARLVDGPTASDGYVLSVPAGERARTLVSLRADSRVVLAEPIDGDGGS